MPGRSGPRPLGLWIPRGKLAGVSAAAGVSGRGPQGQRPGTVAKSWGTDENGEPPERGAGGSGLSFGGDPLSPLHTPPPPSHPTQLSAPRKLKAET